MGNVRVVAYLPRAMKEEILRLARRDLRNSSLEIQHLIQLGINTEKGRGGSR